MISSVFLFSEHNMSIIKQMLIGVFCLLPTLVLADDISYLNFTVTNLSSTRVFFTSKDMFDFGKRVGKNETKTITYDFPPKIITIKILNESNEGYELLTDASCDMLGWPAFRQLTQIANGEDVEGVAMYKAGNVHITIADMVGSTVSQKRLTCSLSNS